MIVGLSGYARSGKDTVASLLTNHTRRAFADPMRDALYTLNPIIFDAHERVSHIVDRFGWDKAKVMFPELRRLLQVLGTEVGRQMIDQDVWVTMATKDLLPSDDVVFADVRFPNEARAIKALGGTVWRINRPGNEPINAHSSETAMDDWEFDATLDNSGSLEDLQAQVETALIIFALPKT